MKNRQISKSAEPEAVFLLPSALHLMALAKGASRPAQKPLASMAGVRHSLPAGGKYAINITCIYCLDSLPERVLP